MLSSAKRHRGRTPISRTPFRITTSGMPLTASVEDRTHALLRRRLARFGTMLRRVDVRFKDINGPRGGVDTIARIHLSVAGRPAVFVQERALDAGRALSQAAASAARALDRAAGKHGLRAQPPTIASVRPVAARPAPRLDAGPKAKPSRTATRKRARRAKAASGLSRRVRRAKHTPRARASRAQLQRRRAMRTPRR
jgi:hypothetical protein